MEKNKFFGARMFCYGTLRHSTASTLALNTERPLHREKMFCKMYSLILKDNSAKNDTFRIFCSKLYVLLSVDVSINQRNKIIFGGIRIIKYGSVFDASTVTTKFTR